MERKSDGEGFDVVEVIGRWRSDEPDPAPDPGTVPAEAGGTGRPASVGEEQAAVLVLERTETAGRRAGPEATEGGTDHRDGPGDGAPDEPPARHVWLGARRHRAAPRHDERGDAEQEPGHDLAPVVQPRLWQRRVAVLRDQGHRRLRWVMAAVVALVGLCVALLVLHTPLAAVRHVSVQGAQHTGAPAVLAAAGLTSHPPLIDVDPHTAAARIEALPWVAHAVVLRRWPDAVAITVTERVPLGAVARPGGASALVDATGRVLAWEPGTGAGLVLSVPVPPGRPGTALPSADRPVLVVGAALTGPLAGRVHTVSVGAAGWVDLWLNGGVVAELGPPDALHAKLAALASVLQEARPPGPATIDLTIPDQPTVGPPPPASRATSGGR